jgi:hypothetical protein
MKMFKVCGTCIENLNTINYPSGKLAKESDSFKKCPMKPTCSGQPERSKREDSKCAMRCAFHGCCMEPYICEKHSDCVIEMRCSEHCGNTVRGK